MVTEEGLKKEGQGVKAGGKIRRNVYIFRNNITEKLSY